MKKERIKAAKAPNIEQKNGGGGGTGGGVRTSGEKWRVTLSFLQKRNHISNRCLQNGEGCGKMGVRMKTIKRGGYKEWRV